MRIAISLFLSGCTCAALGEGEESLRRGEYERALERCRAALAECGLDEIDGMRAVSMIARCLMELGRLEEAERVVREAAEVIDSAKGEMKLSEGFDFFFAEYKLRVARRALLGIDEARTEGYKAIKLQYARPWFEEALALLARHEGPTPVGRFAALRAAKALQEQARSYPNRRELLDRALEKIKSCPGPEFDTLRDDLKK